MIIRFSLSVTATCRRHFLFSQASSVLSQKPSNEALNQTEPLLSHSQKFPGMKIHHSSAVPNDFAPDIPILPSSPSIKIPSSPNSSQRLPQRKVSFKRCRCEISTPVTGIQRTVVKSYTIDKFWPKCPICNPTGDIPYPNFNPDADPDQRDYGET